MRMRGFRRLIPSREGSSFLLEREATRVVSTSWTGGRGKGQGLRPWARRCEGVSCSGSRWWFTQAGLHGWWWWW